MPSYSLLHNDKGGEYLQYIQCILGYLSTSVPSYWEKCSDKWICSDNDLYTKLRWNSLIEHTLWQNTLIKHTPLSKYSNRTVIATVRIIEVSDNRGCTVIHANTLHSNLPATPPIINQWTEHCYYFLRNWSI